MQSAGAVGYAVYKDPSQPIIARAEDLLVRLTVGERDRTDDLDEVSEPLLML
jgi:hypothetical protein